jgi:integrase
MRLTDLLIKRLKPPKPGATKQVTYFDDQQKGLGIRVSVGGTKSFIVMYGKRRKLRTLGRYPTLKLAEARRKAKQLLGEVVATRDGDRPSLSFSEARERFLEDARMRTRASTYTEYARLLNKHFLFSKPVIGVTRQDIANVIEGLRESPSTAAHAFMAIKVMMNWAEARGLIQASPVPAIKFKQSSRSRVLTDDELRAVWKRAGEIGHPYGTVVKLLVLTGQRRGEIAALRRSWIKDDAITFPTSITKNKREHRIPIGPLTNEIIESIPDTGELLFPARGKPDQPLNGWAKAKREFDKPLSFSNYTLHDLRRTYSSNLAKLGVPIHVTERLLNHVTGTISGVAAVYNRHSYWSEMVEAVRVIDSYLPS